MATEIRSSSTDESLLPADRVLDFADSVAGGVVLFADGEHVGVWVLVADVGGVGASLDESALGWGVDCFGDAAFDFDGGAFVFGVGDGDCGEEGSGVGVLGVGEDLFGGSDFDDFAEVHDCDAVAHVAGDGEVVGDVEVGDAETVAEFGHEFHDGDADGDVEHGGGFVGDDESGVHDEGSGDGDSLALAAGEFVGVAEQKVLWWGESDESEEFEDSFFAFGDGADFLDGEGFGDGVEDGASGVHRLVGVLEDHLDSGAELFDSGAGDGGDVALVVAVVELDSSFGGV